MKATIDLPEDVLRRAKAEAALRGWKFRELVVEGILRVLEHPESVRTEPGKSGQRFSDGCGIVNYALLPRPAKAVFSRLGFLFGFTVAFWMGAMPAPSAEPAADKYLIEFSTDANLEGLTVNYAITGRAGGIGIRISDPVKSPAYSVDVSTAKTLKAIVMSPHYKTVLIDAPDLGKDAPRRTKVELEPLANVPFKGHIVLPKDVDPEKFRLEILYCANWGMDYFGYIDGSPPCFVAGQADIRPDGSFEAALPDMTHDPVMGNHKDDGSNLILILRHKKSGNLLFRLLQEKDGLDANLLRIEDRYEFIELRAVED